MYIDYFTHSIADISTRMNATDDITDRYNFNYYYQFCYSDLRIYYLCNVVIQAVKTKHCLHQRELMQLLMNCHLQGKAYIYKLQYDKLSDL